MFNIFKNRKVLFTLAIIETIGMISLGAYLRPGIEIAGELASAVFIPKPIKMEKKLVTDEEIFNDLVEKDLQTEESKLMCRSFSEQKVGLKLSKDMNAKANKYFSKAANAEMKISNANADISMFLNEDNVVAGVEMRSAGKNFQASTTK